MHRKNKIPDAAEFGQLRAYLAQKGAGQEWVAENTDSTKSRAENADMLKAAMKELT